MSQPKLEHDLTRLEPARLERISPLVRRMVAPNGSPFTFTGTCTYIVGQGPLAIIDPGPDDPAWLEALMQALRNEIVEHIVITHTHRDHSPGARALQRRTGAKIAGCAPHVADPDAPAGGLDASHDLDHVPDAPMRDGDVLSAHGFTLEAVHTPGHAANHLCFALREENALFSGDHVMAWSTSIVAPPDGDMRAYMASLDRLRGRGETRFWPGHGAPVEDPQSYMAALAAHRRQREANIVKAVEAGHHSVQDIVEHVYEGLPDHLKRAAGMSAFSHLEDLVARGILKTDGRPSLSGDYRKA